MIVSYKSFKFFGFLFLLSFAVLVSYTAQRID